MRVKTQLKFLGTDIRQGKQDPSKYYKIVSFLDGSQSVNILTDSDGLFQSLKDLQQLTNCDCELDLSLGKYTKCMLLTCQPILEKK